MTKILLILILIIFFSLLFTSIFYSKRNKKSAKKTKFSASHPPLLKKQEFNPDISTDNWDLHKLRLYKFRRSQYKGLTFFVSSENKIYYLSEEGKKVYC
tara:strand:- start:124 stop:420 length:297 start_codon:yes stop_codon:yes gene_type:complete